MVADGPARLRHPLGAAGRLGRETGSSAQSRLVVAVEAAGGGCTVWWLATEICWAKSAAKVWMQSTHRGLQSPSFDLS